MAVGQKNPRKPHLANKAHLLRLANEINHRMGVVIDPNASAEHAKAMMIASGIRPDDCEFSREIIRLRDQKREDYPALKQD